MFKLRQDSVAYTALAFLAIMAFAYYDHMPNAICVVMHIIAFLGVGYFSHNYIKMSNYADTVMMIVIIIMFIGFIFTANSAFKIEDESLKMTPYIRYSYAFSLMLAVYLPHFLKQYVNEKAGSKAD
jgi:hypothetical protein